MSPDKAFGKRLAVALKAAGGAVDTHPSLDALARNDLQAALIVLHVEGAVASAAAEMLPRLGADTRVIAVLPRSNLAAVVDIMQASDRVAGMIVAEDLDVRQLSAMATRVLAGDIFGLDKTLLWGAQIHAYLVGDYQEKSLCISQVSEFAETMGVRRKYRESIEQCLDEMLMNALYDAPVDEQGRQIFSEIPTKTRISLRVEQKAVVQYACDGTQFAIAVRDAFGTLERSTVLRYLHKCLHNEQQIDRKVGGAGLGLYLMTSSSASVLFNVLPGVATEAVCTFDLETPKQQLEQFGFFTEKIDAAGRLAAGPSRRLPTGASHPVERRAPRPPPTPRGLIPVLVGAIVATLALIVVAAWPRLVGERRAQITIRTVPNGATIEVEGKNAGTATDALVVRDLEIGRAYPIVARLDGHEPRTSVVQPHDGTNEITLELRALAPTVRIESHPTGATVELDGAPAGTTPLALTTLEPSTQLAVRFAKTGYKDATTQLEVPGPGKEVRLVQPLAVAADLARIRVVSEPPGAQVLQNGQLLAGVTTPADVLVEAGKPVRFMLTMPGKVPALLEPITPGRGADGVVRSAKLVDGVPLKLSTNLDGTVNVEGAPHCQKLDLPAVCIVAPGSYSVELAPTAPNATAARITRTLTLTTAPLEARFDLGYVEAAGTKRLQLGRGPGVKRAAFEAGSRRVTVLAAPGSQDPPRAVTVRVKAGATVIAE